MNERKLAPVARASAEPSDNAEGWSAVGSSAWARGSSPSWDDIELILKREPLGSLAHFETKIENLLARHSIENA